MTIIPQEPPSATITPDCDSRTGSTATGCGQHIAFPGIGFNGVHVGTSEAALTVRTYGWLAVDAKRVSTAVGRGVPKAMVIATSVNEDDFRGAQAAGRDRDGARVACSSVSTSAPVGMDIRDGRG